MSATQSSALSVWAVAGPHTAVTVTLHTQVQWQNSKILHSVNRRKLLPFFRSLKSHRCKE